MWFYARKKSTESSGFCSKIDPSSTTHDSMRMVSENVVPSWIQPLCSYKSCGKVVSKILPAFQLAKCLGPSSSFRGCFQIKEISPEQINDHEAVDGGKENVKREKYSYRVSKDEQPGHHKNNSNLKRLLEKGKGEREIHLLSLSCGHLTSKGKRKCFFSWGNFPLWSI